MYTIIACPNCEFVKIVPDEPESTGCPRCQKRLPFRQLKHFFQTDDAEIARQARGELQAKINGNGEAFGRYVDNGLIDENETRIDSAYIKAQGFDEETLAAETTPDRQPTRSRPEIVRDALTTLDAPTEAAVIEYAVDHEVPPAAAETILQRLRDHGEVIETNRTLRLV